MEYILIQLGADLVIRVNTRRSNTHSLGNGVLLQSYNASAFGGEKRREKSTHYCLVRVAQCSAVSVPFIGLNLCTIQTWKTSALKLCVVACVCVNRKTNKRITYTGTMYGILQCTRTFCMLFSWRRGFHGTDDDRQAGVCCIITTQAHAHKHCQPTQLFPTCSCSAAKYVTVFIKLYTLSGRTGNLCVLSVSGIQDNISIVCATNLRSHSSAGKCAKNAIIKTMCAAHTSKCCVRTECELSAALPV